MSLPRQVAGSICKLTFYVLMATCAISGICAFGLILFMTVALLFTGPDIIPVKWAEIVAGPSFLVFFVSAVPMIALGYLVQRLG